MKAGLWRDLKLLESLAPQDNGESFRDPTTGEMVPLAELMDFATVGEIQLAEAICLAALLEHKAAMRQIEAGPDAVVDHDAKGADHQKFAGSYARGDHQRRDVTQKAIDDMLAASPEQLEKWFNHVLGIAFARRRANPAWRLRDRRGDSDCAAWPLPAWEEVPCAAAA